MCSTPPTRLVKICCLQWKPPEKPSWLLPLLQGNSRGCQWEEGNKSTSGCLRPTKNHKDTLASKQTIRVQHSHLPYDLGVQKVTWSTCLGTHLDQDTPPQPSANDAESIWTHSSQQSPDATFVWVMFLPLPLDTRVLSKCSVLGARSSASTSFWCWAPSYSDILSLDQDRNKWRLYHQLQLPLFRRRLEGFLLPGLNVKNTSASHSLENLYCHQSRSSALNSWSQCPLRWAFFSSSLQSQIQKAQRPIWSRVKILQGAKITTHRAESQRW